MLYKVIIKSSVASQELDDFCQAAEDNLSRKTASTIAARAGTSVVYIFVQ